VILRNRVSPRNPVFERLHLVRKPYADTGVAGSVALLPYTLVDSHCHLNFDRFDSDRPAVLERAQQAGVGRVLNPGIDLATSQAALDLAERYTAVFAAVGVHPNDALSWEDGTLDELCTLAMQPKVVAIGEIGLDYYWEKTPHELQQRIFHQQLQLAAEAGLPVVVHVRDKDSHHRHAMQDALDILTGWQSTLPPGLAERPGVLHSFSDGPQAALRATAANFCIGITGPVTFKNSDLLREVVLALPLERLLIETDAPFLTPHPHRGERNEPGYVQFVAQKIAQIRGVDFENVAHITTTSAKRLFLW
jgi:TatD DNase family protein